LTSRVTARPVHAQKSRPCLALSARYSSAFRSPELEADFLRELAELEAESIGWQPLAPSAYLHVSDESATEVRVVGVPQAGAAVLLAG